MIECDQGLRCLLFIDGLRYLYLSPYLFVTFAPNEVAEAVGSATGVTSKLVPTLRG